VRRLRWLLVVPLLPALYLLAALIGAMIPGGHTARLGEPRHPVGFAAGPIHYDILLPLTPALRDRFAFAEASGVPVDHPAAEWLVVGWGAEGFYTTIGTFADVNAAAIWRGITGDDGVLHLDVAGSLPPDAGLEWRLVSDTEREALIAAIEAEFLLDPQNQAVPLVHPGHRDTDAFFRARSAFHLFRTCNVWVGEVLREAGLPFGAWTPTIGAVRLSLWWHTGQERP